MSYRPTVAGHTDAPLERMVSVEPDPEFEALTSAFREGENRIFPSTTAVRRFFRDFFASRQPWSQERVYAAFLNQHMPRFTVRDAVRRYDTHEFIPKYYFLTVALDMCADRVLHNNPCGFSFKGLGSQRHRVLVDDLAIGRVSAIGTETKETLLILTQDCDVRVVPEISLSDSVVVHLGRVTQNGDLAPMGFRNMGLYSSTIYLGRDPFDVWNPQIGLDIRALDDARARASPLYTYVHEVMRRCEDPHSLYDHYGSSPGPKIRRTLLHLIEREHALQRGTVLVQNKGGAL